MRKKFEDDTKDIDEKDKELLQAVKDGKITKEQYFSWRMKVNLKLQKQVREMAKTLDKADEDAKDEVNSVMPKKYAESFNKQGYDTEKALNIETDFEVQNVDAVQQAVAGRFYAKYDQVANDRYNRRRLSSMITAGVIQGKSMQDIARDIRPLCNSNKNSAIRNARTWVTGVENGGRHDAALRMKELGVKERKIWLAVTDMRTRFSHRALDEEIKNIDEKFSNGGQYPADPDLPPEERYNCRCRYRILPDGFNPDMSIRHVDIGDMTYDEWKAGKERKQRQKAQQQTQQPQQAPQHLVHKEYTQLHSALGDKDYNAYRALIAKNAGLEKLYDDYANKITVTHKHGGGVFRNFNNSIVFGFEHHKGMNRYGTLGHEFGHAIDYNWRKKDVHYTEADAINSILGAGSPVHAIKHRPSQSDEFLKAFREDAKAGGAEISNIQKLHGSDYNACSGVMDMLDARYGTQKKGLLSWGHGDKYYNRFWNNYVKSVWGADYSKSVKQAYLSMGFDASNLTKAKSITRSYDGASELWANCMSAITVGGDEYKMMKKYCPKSMALIERWIKDNVK